MGHPFLLLVNLTLSPSFFPLHPPSISSTSWDYDIGAIHFISEYLTNRSRMK